jgi:hypothetical protein
MTFEELPDHARLWVYTADRELTAAEQAGVLKDLEEFLRGWAAHGAALTAAGVLLHDRVLAVGLDEQRAGATGCSIDKLVGLVKAQGEALGVDWFDRHQVLWRQPGEEAWQATRTPEFWALRKAGVVHGKSEVVDPLRQTVGAARSGKEFLVSTFDESWHSAMWS